MLNQSEDGEIIRQIGETYKEFLAKPENADCANRLSALARKYQRVAAMDSEAETNPFVGLERDNLLREVETELDELSSQIKETCELNLWINMKLKLLNRIVSQSLKLGYLLMKKR